MTLSSKMTNLCPFSSGEKVVKKKILDKLQRILRARPKAAHSQNVYIYINRSHLKHRQNIPRRNYANSKRRDRRDVCKPSQEVAALQSGRGAPVVERVGSPPHAAAGGLPDHPATHCGDTSVSGLHEPGGEPGKVFPPRETYHPLTFVSIASAGNLIIREVKDISPSCGATRVKVTVKFSDGDG